MGKLKKEKKVITNSPITLTKTFKSASYHLFLYMITQFLVMFFVVIGFAIDYMISNYKLLSMQYTSEQMATRTLAVVVQERIGSIYVATLLISGALTIYMLYKRLAKDEERLQIKKISFVELSTYLGLGVLLNLMISGLLNAISSFTTLESSETLTTALQQVLECNFFVVLLAIGIIAPIVEELTFRYGIFGPISKVSPKLAIAISGLVFGLIHANLVQSTYATLLGFLFAFVYYKSKNLTYTIILHIAINSSSVICSKLFASEFEGLTVCTFVALVMVLVSALLNLMNKKKQAIEENMQNLVEKVPQKQ